jgi:hypothetical protein
MTRSKGSLSFRIMEARRLEKKILKDAGIKPGN